MTEPYDNYIEWNPQAAQQTFCERMKRAAVRGLEVTEATQEEWDAAKHAFALKYERKIGD